MPKYRDQLPQLSGRLFLTDGGLETTLIFHVLVPDWSRKVYPALSAVHKRAKNWPGA